MEVTVGISAANLVLQFAFVYIKVSYQVAVIYRKRYVYNNSKAPVPPLCANWGGGGDFKGRPCHLAEMQK